MFDSRILRDAGSGLTVDLTAAPEIPWTELESPLTRAMEAMAALEAGAVANVDEGRQVGHFWLRAPDLAPDKETRARIQALHDAVAALDPGEHRDVLLIGIGGSALGPQLLATALQGPQDRARLHVLDNTDPDGIARQLERLELGRTLVLVVSKSGGTAETHNGMLAAMAAYAAAGLRFEEHAIAITVEGSALHGRASGWLGRFPLWDWVGGRFSVTGAVGLVPMALCGWDWEGFLAGAAATDALTRRALRKNPAALLAAAWYLAGDGRGDRALVVEPYRDRFLLLSRYLQQLVMESLGKAIDRRGREVHQGLAVYGNKGSTDQHALMQQVRDGRDDVFVHFVETVQHGPALPVEDGLQASDTLVGLLYGTRRALTEVGRPSVTLAVPDASARSLGALIALFERSVGLYAELIDVNAYHQPGVEAGKRAARGALALLVQLRGALRDEPATAIELAGEADALLAWRLLTHLAATGRARMEPGARPALDRFRKAR